MNCGTTMRHAPAKTNGCDSSFLEYDKYEAGVEPKVPPSNHADEDMYFDHLDMWTPQIELTRYCTIHLLACDNIVPI